MALAEQLGSMSVQVEADLSKWKKDVEDLKKDVVKDAEEIEKKFGAIGPAVSKNNTQILTSFKGIDAAIVNNIKSTNDLIKVNDNLYLEVSKKTGKLITTYRILDDTIQKNVRGNVLGWQTLGRVGETELNKTSKSVNVLSGGMRGATRSLGIFGSEIARATGYTGKFGTLIGSIASGMLVGGWIGAGLAAGAAAIHLISQRTTELVERLRKAISSIVSFKDKTEGIKFEVDTGNIRQQTEYIENRIDELNKNVAERVSKLFSLRATAGSDKVLIAVLEKRNEEDENRITILEEYLEKLKEQKELEDAIGLTKSELNNLGLKELNISDETKKKLEEQKKLISDIKTQLADPNITGDTRLALQNQLNSALEDYNSLIGRQSENNSVEDLIKKIKTENELKELTSGLTTEILESSKRLLENSLALARTDEERVKILSTIRDIQKEIDELTPSFDIEEIDAGKFAEDLSKGFAEAEEKRQQAEREAAEVLQELKLRGIANEFDEREARINAEYEYLLEKYKDNAEIITEIEKARQTDLLRLEHERFTTMLSFANQIGDILINKLNIAGHTFVGQMLRALDIAASILATLSNLSGALGGSGGIFGLVSSFIPGGGLIAAAAGARAGGGPVEQGKIYRVGELGEEWFRPWTSGTIIPNHQIASSLSQSNSSTFGNGDLIREIRMVADRVGAMNENLVLKDFNVSVKNEAPGIKTTVVTGEKVKNDLNRSGMNLNER